MKYIGIKASIKNYGLVIGISLSTISCIAQKPFTDPSNKGGWKLNKDVSDEFESKTLDETKWLIQGRNGEYRSNWKGRAPSQFSTENVRIEDGKLKLQARWEPDFKFHDKPDKDGKKYENITVAAVISKKMITYGYLEIKCKAADASVTSAFWALGKGAELDVFEFSGRPSLPNKEHLHKEFWSSIHDWGKQKGKSVWTNRLQLPYRVSDDFHVYACEWDENYLKFYADGKLIKEATKAEIGEGWVIDSPMSIWVDSEVFPWHGAPAEKDLPVDYQIEYIRVWQKKK